MGLKFCICGLTLSCLSVVSVVTWVSADGFAAAIGVVGVLGGLVLAAFTFPK